MAETARRLAQHLLNKGYKPGDMPHCHQEACDWLCAELDDIRGKMEKPELPPRRFDCPTCGPAVSVDEDGCCAMCGADAKIVDETGKKDATPLAGAAGGASVPSGHPSDAGLVEWAVKNAGRNLTPQCRWGRVRDIFAVGSTSAHYLCRRFGLDPDEMVGVEPEAEEDDQEEAEAAVPAAGGEVVRMTLAEFDPTKHEGGPDGVLCLPACVIPPEILNAHEKWESASGVFLLGDQIRYYYPERYVRPANASWAEVYAAANKKPTQPLSAAEELPAWRRELERLRDYRVDRNQITPDDYVRLSDRLNNLEALAKLRAVVLNREGELMIPESVAKHLGHHECAEHSPPGRYRYNKERTLYEWEGSDLKRAVYEDKARFLAAIDAAGAEICGDRK